MSCLCSSPFGYMVGSHIIRLSPGGGDSPFVKQSEKSIVEQIKSTDMTHTRVERILALPISLSNDPNLLICVVRIADHHSSSSAVSEYKVHPNTVPGSNSSSSTTILGTLNRPSLLSRT